MLNFLFCFVSFLLSTLTHETSFLIEAGTCHNLDLSLGISPSSKMLKNCDFGGEYSFGCMASKIPEEIGTMVLLFASLCNIFFMGDTHLDMSKSCYMLLMPFYMC